MLIKSLTALTFIALTGAVAAWLIGSRSCDVHDLEGRTIAAVFAVDGCQ